MGPAISLPIWELLPPLRPLMSGPIDRLQEKLRTLNKSLDFEGYNSTGSIASKIIIIKLIQFNEHKWDVV